MKNLKNTLRNTLYLVLALVLCVGCNMPTEVEYTKSKEQNYLVIEIDSCEYLMFSNRPVSADMAITHKGNCKYCKERALAN